MEADLTLTQRGNPANVVFPNGTNPFLKDTPVPIPEGVRRRLHPGTSRIETVEMGATARLPSRLRGLLWRPDSTQPTPYCATHRLRQHCA
jgi:hypothetical protein